MKKGSEISEPFFVFNRKLVYLTSPVMVKT